MLKELRARLDAHFTGKVLLAEANMWHARRALDDVNERLAVLEPERHEHAGHDGKVERHVELVARAEVRTDLAIA